MDANRLIQSFIEHYNAYITTMDINYKQQLKIAMDQMANNLTHMGYNVEQILQQYMQQQQQQTQQYMGQPQQQQQQQYMGQPQQQQYMGQPQQQQQYMGQQQSQQYLGQQQTQQPATFGQPVNQSNNSCTSTTNVVNRSRRKRTSTVNTVNTNASTDSAYGLKETANTNCNTETILPPRGKEHRLTPIVESPIEAKLINTGDELVYIYRGESIMYDLKVVNITENEPDTVTSPVPDVNIIGNELYATIKDTKSYDIAYGTYVVEYNIFDASTFLEPLLYNVVTDKFRILDMSSRLLQDIKNGSSTAKWLDSKLTDYVNTIMSEYLDSKIIIDSFALDIKELDSVMKGHDMDESLFASYKEMLAYLESILETSVLTNVDNPEQGDHIQSVCLNETFIVLEDFQDKEVIGYTDLYEILENESGPVGFTPDSAPNVYKALSEIYETKPNSFVYLLTDKTKYMLYKLDTEKGILIKKVA